MNHQEQASIEVQEVIAVFRADAKEFRIANRTQAALVGVTPSVMSAMDRTDGPAPRADAWLTMLKVRKELRGLKEAGMLPLPSSRKESQQVILDHFGVHPEGAA